MSAIQRLMLTLPLLVMSACGTEAQRRTFPIEVTARLPIEANDHGWKISLESAQVSVGPIRFFSGRPAFASRLSPLSWIVGTAWAHPGHYSAGDAMGELLQTRVVDLLAAEPIELGTASAVTGDYGSAQLELPADPTNASATLLGTATHESGRSVRFHASLSLTRAIEGIAFEQTIGTEPGRVRLTIAVDRWLSRIDFGRLDPSSATEVVEFEADSQPMNALTRGVEDTSAYQFTWEQ